MALSDNLLHYWSLNEASGTRVDAHASSDLTDVNTVGSAAGKQGNAADIELDNDEALEGGNISDLNFDGSGSFSIAYWFNAESLGVNGWVLHKDSFGTTGWGLVLSSSSQAMFFIRDPVGGTVTVSSGSLSVSTWYFVVAVFDAVADELRISINGGAPVTQAYSGTIGTGTSIFAIGRHSTSFLRYDGLVDEPGIWGRDITADIAELYNSGNGRDYAYIAGGAAAAPPTKLSLAAGMHVLSGGIV